MVTYAPDPASACFLRDFEISTEPSLPGAGEPFDLIVDYQGSEFCIWSEELVVIEEVLRFEIECDCFFTATSPVPQHFSSTVPGLPAGLKSFEAFNTAVSPEPSLEASTHILIGHAPSIPLSPLASTLLALTLAAAAVWVLRR